MYHLTVSENIDIFDPLVINTPILEVSDVVLQLSKYQDTYEYRPEYITPTSAWLVDTSALAHVLAKPHPRTLLLNFALTHNDSAVSLSQTYQLAAYLEKVGDTSSRFCIYFSSQNNTLGNSTHTTSYSVPADQHYILRVYYTHQTASVSPTLLMLSGSFRF